MLALSLCVATALLGATPAERAGAVFGEALTSKDPQLQSEALTALGLAKLKDAKPRLLTGLAAEDGKIRFGAARGLRYLGDAEVVPELEAAWAKEKGFLVKRELAIAAGALGAKAMAPKLREALTEKNDELRLAAAFALKDLGDPSGDAHLTRAGNPPRKHGPQKAGSDRWARKVLKGEKPGDKTLAVRTLAELGDGADVEVLTPEMESEDAVRRVYAAAGVLRFMK